MIKMRVIKQFLLRLEVFTVKHDDSLELDDHVL